MAVIFYLATILYFSAILEVVNVYNVVKHYTIGVNLYGFPVSLTDFLSIGWLTGVQDNCTDIYDLKGGKIYMYFCQLLRVFFKMVSPIFTVKSFPQYLALIASQCALRKHKLRYWACARRTVRALHASHPSCIARSQTVLLSMRVVRASFPRMHFWTCAEDWRTGIGDYCKSDVQSLSLSPNTTCQPPLLAADVAWLLGCSRVVP